MTLRVVGVARTSGDEADTGQDCQAQADQLRADLEAAGYEVVHSYLDDGVSGDTSPLERPGFNAAYQDVRGGRADAVGVQDWTRFSRQHPIEAMAELDRVVRRGVPVLVTRDQSIEQPLLDEQTGPQAAIEFFLFYGGWQERQHIRERTQLRMSALKDGTVQTRSGKPVGRPEKVSEDEAKRFHSIAIRKGAAEAARQLSLERGVDRVKDETARKRRNVPRTTLISAFKRFGFPWPTAFDLPEPDEKPDPTETVSDTQGAGPGDNGPVSDSEVTAKAARRKTRGAS